MFVCLLGWWYTSCCSILAACTTRWQCYDLGHKCGEWWCYYLSCKLINYSIKMIYIGYLSVVTLICLNICASVLHLQLLNKNMICHLVRCKPLPPSCRMLKEARTGTHPANLPLLPSHLLLILPLLRLVQVLPLSTLSSWMRSLLQKTLTLRWLTSSYHDDFIRFTMFCNTLILLWALVDHCSQVHPDIFIFLWLICKFIILLSWIQKYG